MNALIVGASSGLGRALAEELAACGANLFLAASDLRDLEPLAADLRTRFGIKAAVEAVDLRSFDAALFRQACLGALGSIDALFYAAGVSLIEKDPSRLSGPEIEALAAVNFTAGVKIVNSFIDDLARAPRAVCVGIGSVAEARPRGQNTVYAASKRGLEFYFSGLRQLLAGSPVKVQFYRVGYMDTQLSFGRDGPLPKADPKRLAAAICRRLDKDFGVAYLPGWWGLAAAAYRLIPWPLFKRMSPAAGKPS